MKTVGIGLVGLGTVGQGVVRVLERSRERIAARSGLDIQIRHAVVRDPRKPRAFAPPANLIHTDLARVLADPDTQVVVELVGGTDAAATALFGAVDAGKDVVTANKELLAVRGRELFERAHAAGRCVAFEASCVGGVPIVGALRTGLAANRIVGLFGIVNGTCNYILTEMLSSRKSYAEALAEAQAAGFAEADPALDVSGVDSARKLAVLGSLAFGVPVDLAAISVEGIERIELTDLLAGEELGYVCKLLAIGEREDDALSLRVHPAFISQSHPLASVAGPFNAVSVRGDAVGHTLFYGRGAGAMPTASAVVADMIEVGLGRATPPGELLAAVGTDSAPKYQPIDELRSRFYLRMMAYDRPGVMGKLTTVLGAQAVSLRAVVQHEPVHESPAGSVPIVVTTHLAREGSVRDAVREIARLDVVTEPPVVIRVVDEHEEL